MTRNDYLILRRTNTVPPSLFYGYYEANAYTNHILPEREFHPLFARFVQFLPPHILDNVIKKVVRYWDTAFNINILMTRESKIIKIY